MKKTILSILLLGWLQAGAQSAVTYTVNFENADQHEARIEINFTDLQADSLELTMSRSSPGRYALHEFVKNVYDFKAFDANGTALPTHRPNPYDWKIPVSGTTLKVSYTLFANHADGTYSDISESHAHLNMPATLIYAPELKTREHEITFYSREDLNWKTATQLKQKEHNTYSAPNLDYLMDSPVELSDHETRSMTIQNGNHEQRIIFALHHNSDPAIFDAFFEKVKKIVAEEIAVFGEAPNYDFGEYTFLACYLPWAHGDGMEHRNSTILTSSSVLSPATETRLLSTVAHEFFHAWNVERLRPATLEPFDYRNANMSEALWFAEGFTSYYTNLTMKRAGIITETDYLKSITPTYNYVWNSPARAFFNPIEMSYQAPFVDAATSVDPVNRGNTFISYYAYGHMLGLALDLQLRSSGKSLDDYFKKLWQAYGKTETPYTLEELEKTLSTYAGERFARNFFREYIYQAHQPDYESLLGKMGVAITYDKTTPYLGAGIENNNISSYPQKGSPAYKAGLSKGDRIMKVNGMATAIPNKGSFLKNTTPGQEVSLEIERFGRVMKKTVILGYSPEVKLAPSPEASEEAVIRRKLWLGSQRP